MKKILFVTACMLLSYVMYAQNVGIGTTTPLMKLHITKTDSAVVLLENTQTLNTGVKTALYFKTGNGPYPFTGAVKTIGENANQARIGLFTYAQSDPNNLQERLSINDAGNVGIGTIIPAAKLDVNGKAIINGDATVNGDLNINGGVILPLKIVTANFYYVLPADYTIIADMQQNPNKSMQIYLPSPSVTGRIIKVIAINMAQKNSNPNLPNAPYPYYGTVCIYNNTVNLNNSLQSLSSYYFSQTVVPPSYTNYKVGDFENTDACTVQYAGGTVGWVVTDVKSHKESGVYYIF